MDLPLRIDPDFRETAVRVDGLGSDAGPGLQLSHWPGNCTPAELRHDLSSGSALLFARLEPRERARLALGARAIVNNHFDTDGMCALFAVRHPDVALAHADALLDAAACGDFFQVPNEHAFQIECVVEGFADGARSPIRKTLAGLSDVERYQRATDALAELFPRLLAGEVEPWRELWEPELRALRRDFADLENSARDDIVHLDWTVWTAPEAARPFDPGRHALWGRSGADRVLAIGPRADGAGATYRLLVSTRSWFDLASGPPPRRPDLVALASELQRLEGAAGENAWRYQDPASPSPELWFGRAGARAFQEHCPELAPSRLPPNRVRRAVADALRVTLEL